MDARERKALECLRFDWAPTAADAWQPAEGHVAELNAPVLDAVLTAFGDAAASDGRSPLGVAVVGQQGAGKTHMISRAHEEVLRRDGYFFLVSLLHGKNFWQNIRHALLTGLDHIGTGGQSQLRILLGKLATNLKLPAPVARQITGAAPLTRSALDETITMLTDAVPEWGQECRHTARALILLGAHGLGDARDIAEAYLTSESDEMRQERAAWGIHGRAKPPSQVVSELSKLIAFTGPSMLAIDQIDTLIEQSSRSTDIAVTGPVHLPREDLMATIAVGLMDLREHTRRTVTVVACQAQAWEQIRNSQPSAAQRFRRELRLRSLDSAEVARRVVAARFGPRLKRVGFAPPYPTWPVLPATFEHAVDYTPRQLFISIDEQIQVCLDTDTFTPISSFTGVATTARPPAPVPTPRSESELARLDDEFAKHTGKADVSAAVTRSTEDAWMMKLLNAGLLCFTKELSDPDSYSLDKLRRNNPQIHARLRKTPDPQSEDQIHWSFRAIGGDNPGGPRIGFAACTKKLGSIRWYPSERPSYYAPGRGGRTRLGPANCSRIFVRPAASSSSRWTSPT